MSDKQPYITPEVTIENDEPGVQPASAVVVLVVGAVYLVAVAVSGVWYYAAFTETG